MHSKYRQAGVDIDAANAAKKRMGEWVKATWGNDVLSEIGNFGGLFALPEKLTRPVLVSSTDSVGTKLKVAFMANRHDTVGEDIVNHCVNDILVQGADPLFFLDYFACGKLEPDVAVDVVKGISRGCIANGCALIGGETAELPDFYRAGEYDLAGFIVGVVERSRLIDGSSIASGDEVWAFPSSGLHTNGYSLARKIIFEEAGLGIDAEIPGVGRPAGAELLEVHRSYLGEVRLLRERTELRGLAHITGGGLLENIPRILPDGCSVEIETGTWDVPPLFRFLQDRGRVEEREMYRVFNMGVGMVAVIPAGGGRAVPGAGYRWEPWRIGTVVEGGGEVRLTGVA